ncbi:hypothetical protein BpHYR1_007310 [Brachionus plicatilis]|uniref:Uncharacterized protein n=1 Tax=Brachionus plicatilis TaxID=10195 RepID=A0A3M7RB95_BRAPC|nr:hypothetical protein BpHYR1_007310 [Brachionus plicatilis]
MISAGVGSILVSLPNCHLELTKFTIKIKLLELAKSPRFVVKRRKKNLKIKKSTKIFIQEKFLITVSTETGVFGGGY